MSVVVAPGVRLDVDASAYARDARGAWGLFYRGTREALIAARICTDDTLVVPGPKSLSSEGLDADGRLFDVSWSFRYRRGAPRALQSVWVAWRNLPLATAMDFPGAQRAMDAWREHERFIEEKHRQEAEAARCVQRGHLRLVVDNTRATPA